MAKRVEPTMAEDNKVPSCCSMGTDFKAKEYDKSKFEGTWVFNNGPCCGSMTVTKHCLCYTCVCFHVCGVPIVPDMTWTCGDNCWMSQGASFFIYGEGDVVYHSWMCCPWEKGTRKGATTGGAPQQTEMNR